MQSELPKRYRKRKATEAVRLTFWGVRGSTPAPGPSTVKFGGNTTCAELRADGEHIILDAGTGLRVLGLDLMQEFKDKPLSVTLLLTHVHWDHIQGFPFFQPAYQAQNTIRILGYEGARRSLQSTLEVQMDSPFFPISFRDLPAKILIEEMKEQQFAVGKVKVRAARAKHSGVTMGYRLETSAGVIAFVPDHESAPGEDAGALTEIIAGADVLMLDCQYTAEEYPKKVGWGHGCLDDAVRVACEAGVKRLYLFHHDPTHDDDFVENMVARARELACDHDIEIDAAREGEQVVLVAGRVDDGSADEGGRSTVAPG